MDGLLVIDKPVGLTSHDVVARMRRVLGERRIGHTGTLDPNASGVLPLVIGRATRLAKFLSGGRKTYEALVRFGVATDSYDADGTPAGAPWTGPLPSRGDIDAALAAFRGTFMQQPPAYSAKKIDGERSYKAARAARSGHPARPALPAVSVTVHRLELLDVQGEDATLRVECSAGFYVRSLAHDLGARLGTGAHLAALRRTVNSGFTLDDAMPLEFAERSRDDAVEAVLPMESMLPGFGEVVLTDEGLLRALHGRDIGLAEVSAVNPANPENSANPANPVRLVDQLGHLVGIAEPTGVPGVLHPSVVLR